MLNIQIQELNILFTDKLNIFRSLSQLGVEGRIDWVFFLYTQWTSFNLTVGQPQRKPLLFTQNILKCITLSMKSINSVFIKSNFYCHYWPFFFFFFFTPFIFILYTWLSQKCKKLYGRYVEILWSPKHGCTFLFTQVCLLQCKFMQ